MSTIVPSGRNLFRVVCIGGSIYPFVAGGLAVHAPTSSVCVYGLSFLVDVKVSTNTLSVYCPGAPACVSRKDGETPEVSFRSIICVYSCALAMPRCDLAQLNSCQFHPSFLVFALCYSCAGALLHRLRQNPCSPRYRGAAWWHQGTDSVDCLLTCCCFPCSITQMLNETQHRGNVTGSPGFNSVER